MNKLKLLVTIISLIAIGWLVKENVHSAPDRVDAAGAVTFEFLGDPVSGPIFDFSNIAPGFSDSQDVVVTNSDTVAREIGVKGVKTNGAGNLESQMEIVISEGATDLYGGTSGTGPKTLEDFFADSNSFDGISLSILTANNSTTYKFQVLFKESAGNDFQNTNVVFDLKFGLITEVPLACEGMSFSANSPIFGTAGNDNIKGTNGNDLIFALEGNDTVDAKLGNDCIVGGEGNDNLKGAVGRDTILGSEGNDKISGEVDNDTLYGNEGDDDVSGGAGNENIWLGEGNDTADGGAGNDLINGEDGDDTFKGGAGNDTLLGGNDTDSVNGQVGRDTCEGETKIQCEVMLL